MLLKHSAIYYLNRKLVNGAGMIDEQNNLFDFSVLAASHIQAELLTI